MDNGRCKERLYKIKATETSCKNRKDNYESYAKIESKREKLRVNKKENNNLKKKIANLDQKIF